MLIRPTVFVALLLLLSLPHFRTSTASNVSATTLHPARLAVSLGLSKPLRSRLWGHPSALTFVVFLATPGFKCVMFGNLSSPLSTSR